MKTKTAFQWLRLHDIPLYQARGNQGFYVSIECNQLRVEVKTKGITAYVCSAAFVCTEGIECQDVAVLISGHTSQVTKEAAIWHEIGHYLDYRQGAVRGFMTKLKQEARASMKAIKLMKKYGRWEEYKRQWFLDWYDTYLKYYKDKSYKSLIEQA